MAYWIPIPEFPVDSFRTVLPLSAVLVIRERGTRRIYFTPRKFGLELSATKLQAAYAQLLHDNGYSDSEVQQLRVPAGVPGYFK